jgi:hypothetical protein
METRWNRVQLSAEAIFILFTAVSTQTLGPTESAIKWVTAELIIGINRPGVNLFTSCRIECIKLYVQPPPLTCTHDVVPVYVHGQLCLDLHLNFIVTDLT